MESKTVTGGFFGLGLWPNKSCRRCRTELKKGTSRFSCKTCDFNLCHSCYTLPVCPSGHTLESKVAVGSLLCLKPKQCAHCGRVLAKGSTRFSCKPCGCHLCEACWSVLRSPSGAVLAPPPPLAMVLAVPAFPEPEPTPERCKRRACKYGAQCYQRSSAHLERFVHPGDRNYRIGLVSFDGNAKPEFESLWQLFQFHDPDESGHISKAEFEELVKCCETLAPAAPIASSDEAWEAAGGPLHGYVNFRQFVSWTQECLSMEYPIGLEECTEASRPCRFRLLTAGGTRCSCPGFQPAETSAALCVCGHKASMHRSDNAERTFTKFLETSRHDHWEEGKEGLVEISDPGLLGRLQEMLEAAHKTTHNWTRDRGCRLHGVNGCAAACSSKNRKPVPTGYVLVTAYRNQNLDLWQKYSLVKTAIVEECTRPSDVALEPKSVVTSGKILESALEDAYNEWFLFHGTSAAKCKSICSSNFRLNLAGSGATWKDIGATVGLPLYGYGIYLAEHVTKSDEYSEPIPEDESFLPVGEDGQEFHAVILCRVLGGRTNVVTTNEIERDKLKADVFAGPYHSVFGDRVTTLNKPFREIVVYDKDQCYPEFLLVYARNYG